MSYRLRKPKDEIESILKTEDIKEIIRINKTTTETYLYEQKYIKILTDRP